MTKNPESPTCKIYDYVDSGDITPLYNDEVLAEYRIVLSREKFHISSKDVDTPTTPQVVSPAQMIEILESRS